MDYVLEYQDLKDENHVFQWITYEELISMFDSMKTGIVLLGGYWCKNTQAIMDYVNTLAKRRNVFVIYNYDPKFINESQEEEDLRDCKTLDSQTKYYELVEKCGYTSERLVEGTMIPRIPLPTFLAIKNGICIGYYSCEYIKDEYLHLEDSKEDKTLDFADNFLALVEQIKDEYK